MLEKEMRKRKESARDNRIFSCGIGGLAPTPNPRCGTHQELCHLPCHQDDGRSLVVPFCQLRHGRAHSMYTLFSSGSHNPWQAPKKHPGHQVRLGAANHQE